MKRLIPMLILPAIIAILLCGCASPTEAPPPVTEPSTAPTTNPSKPLTGLTDYELLRTMAKEKVILDWAVLSYVGEYPFTTLMLISPEFSELMTRPSAAGSIRNYAAELDDAYPDAFLSFLEPHATEIEAFINDAAKSRTELTDHELLRIMAEKEVCNDWQAFNHWGEYPFSTLMYISPEFNELISRSTAAESLKTHLPSLMAEYPDCALDALYACIPHIETYISKNII